MNYLEWNSRLFEDVIDRGDPNRGLYLYVDRDLLAKLSGLSPEQAVEDFCRAFQVGIGDFPFRRGAESATTWRRRGFPGNPPFVSDLAMTVLAVTEDPIGKGVYARQNALLGLPPLKIGPNGYDIHVPEMWRAWNRWLDGPGSVHGRPTAESHSKWSLQGWSRSQALIRSHDRLQIEGYLASHGASFEAFCTWLVLHHPRFLDRFREEPALAILRAVFEEEAVRLMKVGPRSRSRPCASHRQGLLSFDEFTGTFAGVVMVDSGWVGREVDCGSGRRVLIEDHESLVEVRTAIAELVLLAEGVQHQLADDLVLRFGGESLYVMREDARADAMLQVRSVIHPITADLLVRPDQVLRITGVLKAAGISAKQSPAGFGNWVWFRTVALSPDQPAVLEQLNLGRAVGGERTSFFHGGQQVRNGLYLVGGEPDIYFSGDEPVTEVAIAGERYPVSVDDQRLALSELALPPGRYQIESPCGALLVRTEDFVQHLPVCSDIFRPVMRLPHGYAVKSAERRSSAGTSLAGASLEGIDTREPLVISKRPGTELLLITESGEVSEVNPALPHWLADTGLRPNAVDVLAAIRGTTSPIACVLVRSRTTERVQAIAVPADAPRFDGKVKCHLRPDLVGSLVTGFRSWSWVGQRHPRINKIMSEVMSSPTRVAPAPPRFNPAPEIARTTVAGRLIAENPYDDVLTWLSEREHGSAPVGAFAETWAWLCRRYQLPNLAYYWRRTLKTLEDLGHIERHYDTATIGVAPAVLVALPASSGLYLFAGARPQRLLERLDNPDDDDPVVSEAASNWQLHRRTPVDAQGRPSGPQALYLEWDPAFRDIVRGGLRALGVTMHGLVADALLTMQPAISDLDSVGTRLTMSPGTEIHQRSPTVLGHEWRRASDDTRPGFYSYKLRIGRMFAFRAETGTPLVKVEFSVGEWLLRAIEGRTDLLYADESMRRRLAVPENAPLPRTLARALVMRTGLPPRTSSIGPSPTNYQIYENVDSTTTGIVAQLLNQKPVTRSITMAQQG
ncbi:hypothetical protein ACIA8K_38480 [Catenuloplanes sp. NPDC051500]|uniref:hypothetical protein n=1 Tax=Catenuloplanes sp. NPDC051500 TaxID=3363959 RepID=UPI00379C4431